MESVQLVTSVKNIFTSPWSFLPIPQPNLPVQRRVSFHPNHTVLPVPCLEVIECLPVTIPEIPEAGLEYWGLRLEILLVG
jgi:hypothetical protein